MVSRVVEAKIILLIWLFAASVVSCSIVGAALAIHSDAMGLASISLERRGESIDPQDASNSSQPSALEGGR